jgi:hypothetical protein
LPAAASGERQRQDDPCPPSSPHDGRLSDGHAIRTPAGNLVLTTSRDGG